MFGGSREEGRRFLGNSTEWVGSKGCFEIIYKGQEPVIVNSQG